MTWALYIFSPTTPDLCSFVDLFCLRLQLSRSAEYFLAACLAIMESGALSVLDFVHDWQACQGTIVREPRHLPRMATRAPWLPRAEGPSFVVIQAYHGNSSVYRLARSDSSGSRKNGIRESALSENATAMAIGSKLQLKHHTSPSSETVNCRWMSTTILRNHQRQRKTCSVYGKPT